MMTHWYIPRIYQEFKDYWNTYKRDCIQRYQEGQQSFIPNLLPEFALQLSTTDTLAILHERLGHILEMAISPEYTAIDHATPKIPEVLQSPVAAYTDGSWLKTTNMVGINVRTIHNFWNVVKYVLTIPDVQNSIHLLPIWEPGVVESLYGMSSWHINTEFYSDELAKAQRHLDTVEKQLKAVINILHALGKTVGMDVIPHTDRYSEIVLTNPQYFEWLQREDLTIIRHDDDLYQEVQARIIQFLNIYGAAVNEETGPFVQEVFFSSAVKDAWRAKVLFGHPYDRIGRSMRRAKLIRYLYDYGYEPLPTTMAPPFRDIEVDSQEESKIEDEYGMVWRDYKIKKPQMMSRVFGPLTRYKLYENFDSHTTWEIDFTRPLAEVWDYVCEHYAQIQRHYGFDFMRGDMSHVQMRKRGVPTTLDNYYDILGAVKRYIQQENHVAYFGYFAESFLPPRDGFGYGEEIDHLEASDADVTLGDLQSVVVGTPEFIQRLRRYYDLLHTRSCAPCFTVMTSDKDDPRFDAYYLRGNEARLFIAYFLTDMPSYMALGFETRDAHPQPVPNEYYTKLFVFHETKGHKARGGPYIWGKNGYLYYQFTRLKRYADTIFDMVRERPVRWLIPPDATAAQKVIAWTQNDEHPDYVFMVNLDVEQAADYFAIPSIHFLNDRVWIHADFSTVTESIEVQALPYNGKHYRVEGLEAGEGRAYRIVYRDEI